MTITKVSKERFAAIGMRVSDNRMKIIAVKRFNLLLGFLRLLFGQGESVFMNNSDIPEGKRVVAYLMYRKAVAAEKVKQPPKSQVLRLLSK